MWRRKASQAVKQAAVAVSIEAEVNDIKKADHKRRERPEAAAAAAAAAPAPRQAAGSKRKSKNEHDSSPSKKAVTFAWPRCTSELKPCSHPILDAECFKPCEMENCPSRREAERRALTELTKAAAKGELSSSLISALVIAGILCVGDGGVETDAYAD